MIKINGLEHVSWAAADLTGPERILALFGLTPAGGEEIRDQGVVSKYFESKSGVQFEVIRPLGANSQLERFLASRGPGLHHVCFQVDNLDQACGEIASAGGELVGAPFEDSRGRHAFVHPKSTGGVLIGMIELHPHLKR